METCPIQQAGRQLQELVDRACRGEDIIITREHGTAVRLVPVAIPAAGQRCFGQMLGRISVDEAFFEPLPEDELAAWER